MAEAAGKVVLITGATAGLGAATALACAQAGYRVALAGRREALLAEVAAQIGRPNDTLTIPTDMRRLEDIVRMVAATEERFGAVDVLVANAGVGAARRVVDLSEDELLWQVETNYLGVIRCARAVSCCARGIRRFIWMVGVPLHWSIWALRTSTDFRGDSRSYSVMGTWRL